MHNWTLTYCLSVFVILYKSAIVWYTLLLLLLILFCTTDDGLWFWCVCMWCEEWKETIWHKVNYYYYFIPKTLNTSFFKRTSGHRNIDRNYTLFTTNIKRNLFLAFYWHNDDPPSCNANYLKLWFRTKKVVARI